MEGPLKGIRVIDLSRILAGPYCSMVMGDLGADVIKVERPGTGDDTRSWGPPFLNGQSAYFLCVNRNKRSMTLNLKSAEGVEILKQLVMVSDVLIENFTPGVTEKLGIDYNTLSKINEGLIYCSITGFGSDGPYKYKTGYDMVVSAMGGLMSITGEEDGEPVKVGVAITDVLTGVFAQGAITAALFSRSKTGKGQKIDLSLLECQVASLVNIASSYLVADILPKRWGTAHESIVPYQAFKAKDRPFAICAGNDDMWRRLVIKIGHPELLEDERFSTNPNRVKHRKELVEILSRIFIEKEASYWIKILEEAGIAVSPINNLDEVFSDPQVLWREMVKEVVHPITGRIRMVGIPVKYSETKPAIRLPPPLLGEHTIEILKEILSKSSQEIEVLKQKGVI